MTRYIILYLATLLVIAPMDALWLGVIARDFFKGQIGELMGELQILPAVLFYLMYVVGILVFASGSADATWKSAFLYGAAFGFFAYATYDLTNLAVLKGWTWKAAVVDIAWGSFVTGLAASGGLVISRWLTGALNLQ